MTMIHRAIMVVWGGVFSASLAAWQADQAELVRQLTTTDHTTQMEALERVRGIPTEQVGAELRGALITLLAAKNEVVKKVFQSSDVTLDKVDSVDFIATLSRVVASLRDPQAIPVMVEAVYGGLPMVQALASFGNEAVPAIAKVIDAPESHYEVVNTGLQTLRLMLENEKAQALSEASRERIRQVTRHQLDKPRYFTSLWSAIDLAAALRDPELLTIVRAIAYDADAAKARGVTTDDIAASTRKRAMDRLAGIPGTPQR